jgi:hypothetical protein
VILQAPTRPPGTQVAPYCRPSLAGVTFIVTTGDRFMQALEINDHFEQESPAGRLYVKLKEMSIQVEREWWIDATFDQS